MLSNRGKEFPEMRNTETSLSYTRQHCSQQQFPATMLPGVLQNKFVSHKTQNGSVILDSIVIILWCCALNNVIEGVIPFV